VPGEKPSVSGPKNQNGDTPINTVTVDGEKREITGEGLRRDLRDTCRERGGRGVFGYDAKEIGTRSIRSGAAMGLFLMNHSVAKIMIHGRWLSDAFLVYIRPQVLEWTNQMSSDMIAHDSFFDASNRRQDSSGGTGVPHGRRSGRGRTEGAHGGRVTMGLHIDH
jgi:hypothetical protein